MTSEEFSIPRRLSISIAAAVLLAAAGCGSDSASSGGSEAVASNCAIDSREDLAQAADDAGHPEKYTVGVVAGYSGPGAIYGEYGDQGIAMFTEATGGSLAGRDLEFAKEDNQNLPDKTPGAFQNLLAKSDPNVLFMGNTPSILSLLPQLESLPLLNMNTGGVSPTLRGRSPMLVNLIPLIDEEAEPLAEYVTAERDITKVAGITTNDEFGQTLWGSFEPAFEDAGGQIVGNVTVSLGATDFRAAVSELVQSEPDAIYSGVYGNPLTTFIRQVRQAGFEGPIIGASILQIAATLEAGPAADGMIMTALEANPEASEYAKCFVERFQAKYDEEPSLYAGVVYDGLNMFAEATKLLAEQGKPLDADGLTTALKEIGTFDSVFSPEQELTDENTINGTFGIVEVKDGQFETIKSSTG